MTAMDINSVDPLPILQLEEIRTLAKGMDNTGISIWRNAVSHAILERMQFFIDVELARHGSQYFVLNGDRWIANSPLADVAASPMLREILLRLTQHSMPTSKILREASPKLNIAASLRVLTGTLGMLHSNLFHYDSYVVTALIPLIIPTRRGELHGDLVIYPNLRRPRSSAFVNVMEKAFVENRFVRPLWSMPFVQKRYAAKAIPMTPGNIYFFWGMRSLHANQACSPGNVRSTALFHFADPHAGSTMKMLSGMRHRYLQNRLRKKIEP